MARNPYTLDYSPVTNALAAWQKQKNTDREFDESGRRWESQNYLAQEQLGIQRQGAARQQAEYDRQNAVRREVTNWLAQNPNVGGVPQPIVDLSRIQGDASPVQQYLLAEAKRKSAAANLEAPSSVREWQYYSNLSPEDQQRYQAMKRAQPWLNAGTHFVQPNAANPSGEPLGRVDKDIVGQKTQEQVGEAKGKFIANYPKLEFGIKALERDNATVDAAIDRATAIIDQYGRGAAGMGVLMSKIPESAARQLRAELDLIRANQGFDKLQSMRDASPTGGALGQVSEFENVLLQSTGGNLTQDQQIGALRRTLQDVKAARRSLIEDRRRAFEMDRQRFGGPEIGGGGQAAAPPAAGQSDLKSKYGLE